MAEVPPPPVTGLSATTGRSAAAAATSFWSGARPHVVPAALGEPCPLDDLRRIYSLPRDTPAISVASNLSRAHFLLDGGGPVHQTTASSILFLDGPSMEDALFEFKGSTDCHRRVLGDPVPRGLSGLKDHELITTTGGITALLHFLSEQSRPSPGDESWTHPPLTSPPPLATPWTDRVNALRAAAKKWRDDNAGGGKAAGGGSTKGAIGAASTATRCRFFDPLDMYVMLPERCGWNLQVARAVFENLRRTVERWRTGLRRQRHIFEQTKTELWQVPAHQKAVKAASHSGTVNECINSATACFDAADSSLAALTSHDDDHLDPRTAGDYRQWSCPRILHHVSLVFQSLDTMPGRHHAPPPPPTTAAPSQPPKCGHDAYYFQQPGAMGPTTRDAMSPCPDSTTPSLPSTAASDATTQASTVTAASAATAAGGCSDVVPPNTKTAAPRGSNEVVSVVEVMSDDDVATAVFIVDFMLRLPCWARRMVGAIEDAVLALRRANSALVQWLEWAYLPTSLSGGSPTDVVTALVFASPPVSQGVATCRPAASALSKMKADAVNGILLLTHWAQSAIGDTEGGVDPLLLRLERYPAAREEPSNNDAAAETGAGAAAAGPTTTGGRTQSTAIGDQGPTRDPPPPPPPPPRATPRPDVAVDRGMDDSCRTASTLWQTHFAVNQERRFDIGAIQCLDYAERGAWRTFEHELAKQTDVAAAELRALMETLLTDTTEKRTLLADKLKKQRECAVNSGIDHETQLAQRLLQLTGTAAAPQTLLLPSPANR